MTLECLITTVQGIGANNNNSIMLTVPKLVREKLSLNIGDRFSVKLDDQKRIIYELLEKIP